MPLLDKEGIDRLKAMRPRVCKDCEGIIRQNYCRRCDEFFWDGHYILCPEGKDDGNDHLGHRLTLHIPFKMGPNIEQMRVAPTKTCDDCKGVIRENYCYDCDDHFADGHAEDCIVFQSEYLEYHAKHHRALDITYQQPFNADDVVC